MEHWILIGGASATAALLFWGAYRNEDQGDRLFMTSVTTLLLYAAWSLLTVRFGVYSPLAVNALTISSAGIAWSWGHRQDPHSTGQPLSRADIAAIIVTACALMLYETWPTYYLRAGRDPGPYMVFAIHMVKTGGLDLDLPWMQTVSEELGGLARLSYPAVYSLFERGVSADPADLEPQFMHMFPALSANAYAAFGIEGLVRVNALVMSLAVWATYKLARLLLPEWLSVLCAAVLALNPAVIWAARIQMTEPLTLLTVLTGLYLLGRVLNQERPGWGPAAGFVLGMAVAIRLDAAFSVMALLGASVGQLTGPTASRRGTKQAIQLFMVASGLAWADAYLHANPYLMDLWAEGQTNKLLALNVIGAGIAWVISAAPEIPDTAKPWLQTTTQRLVELGATILAGWVLYDWFVRSLDTTSFNARVIREAAWYVTPAGFFLTPIGIFAVLRTPRWREWLPAIAIGATSIFVFTWQPSISEDHYWASRRFVPYVIPMMIVLVTGGFSAAFTRIEASARHLLPVVGVALVTGYVVQAKSLSAPFLSTSILAGIVQDYDELVGVIPRAEATKDVVLTTDIQIATFLTYAYDVPTILIPAAPDARTAERYAGHAFIGKEANRYLHTDTLVRLGGTYPELTKTKPPKVLYDRTANLHVGRIQTHPRLDAPVLRKIRPTELFTRVGTLQGTAGPLVTTSSAGTLVFGPYAKLATGAHVIRWQGTVTRPGRATFVVTTDRGETVLDRFELDLEPTDGDADLAVLAFSLHESVTDAEFKVGVDEHLELALSGLELQTVATWDEPSVP